MQLVVNGGSKSEDSELLRRFQLVASTGLPQPVDNASLHPAMQELAEKLRKAKVSPYGDIRLREDRARPNQSGLATLQHESDQQRVTYADARWCVVATQPRREWMAQQQIGLAGHETFMPLITQYVRASNRLSRQQRLQTNRKTRTTAQPLFSGYLFVQLNLGIDSWYSINAMAGVTGVICLGNVPATVPDDEIEALKGRQYDAPPTLTFATFQSRDRVLIEHGPFAGRFAIVERDGERWDADTRVRVLLNMLGRKTPVSVRRSYIRMG